MINLCGSGENYLLHNNGQKENDIENAHSDAIYWVVLKVCPDFEGKLKRII